MTPGLPRTCLLSISLLISPNVDLCLPGFSSLLEPPLFVSRHHVPSHPLSSWLPCANADVESRPPDVRCAGGSLPCSFCPSRPVPARPEASPLVPTGDNKPWCPPRGGPVCAVHCAALPPACSVTPQTLGGGGPVLSTARAARTPPTFPSFPEILKRNFLTPQVKKIRDECKSTTSPSSKTILNNTEEAPPPLRKESK